MGTVFNRRLINENSKKDKDLATTVQGLDTRVEALEEAGYAVVDPDPEGEATETLSKIEIDGTVYGISGGGGSTTLTATEIDIASHATSTAEAQPTSVTGSVTVINDGTNWVASHISVVGTPMMADYKEFFSGMIFTLDTTDLDISAGIITGEAQILDTIQAASLGFVPYIIEITKFEETYTTARLIIGTIGTIASGNATSLRA